MFVRRSACRTLLYMRRDLRAFEVESQESDALGCVRDETMSVCRRRTSSGKNSWCMRTNSRAQLSATNISLH